ncbi:carbon-nitrogen family hydrolase [Geoalkalibacter halelectricus]|uniref:Carbon-nitrogen family hydrolase n=1 Tax=Geoalkalibacter halelectricus TaxID=2847045 RepID=A0ABY5ZNP0_9BACT|nr:carbon-nitrogen family hydrolase [Geoalkalibacter halelectricus]MDO3378304.1 carbon-nitrogen family hydrolase [Geoalkalibacter halelectricus]UWZ79309.1 carbon-nitrogen family hydrolase [Geoalkalibacter halelectricus]
MNRQIHAAAVQFNITLGDIARNRAKAFSALQRLADQGVELAVLPEMWSTGYDYRRLAELALETPRIVEDLQKEAARLGLVVVGSLPESENGKLYNTARVIDRGEIRGSYRKLHLFSTMGEDRFLAAGDRTLVASTSLGRLGVAICYDLRFPELFRKLALEGAEILCLPAEWPKPRQEHWRTLLRARAIENQQFVVAANCCGIQGKLDFFGMSLLISPWGEVLAEGGAEDCTPTALLDYEQMTSFRSKIRCFEDRRPEIYGILP